MHLAALNIHPVKSLRGLGVQSAQVDLLGPVGDRRFLVVDSAGLFMTQRTVPRMALVGAFLEGPSLVLRCDGHGEFRVRRDPEAAPALAVVRVWKSEGLSAEDCGDGAAAWLGDALGVSCRLVRVGPAFHRPVLGPAGQPGDAHGFADGYPFLVLSEASLDGLNRRLAHAGSPPVPMDRFRANLVVAGCAPHAEDTWRRVRVGPIIFRAAGPCSRCVITTTDQSTGVRGEEPLRTLAGYRRDPAKTTNVNFGQNLVHEVKSGLLRVGDPVEVLE